jgi:hypothetical protein
LPWSGSRTAKAESEENTVKTRRGYTDIRSVSNICSNFFKVLSVGFAILGFSSFILLKEKESPLREL